MHRLLSMLSESEICSASTHFVSETHRDVDLIRAVDENAVLDNLRKHCMLRSMQTVDDECNIKELRCGKTHTTTYVCRLHVHLLLGACITSVAVVDSVLQEFV